MKVIGYMLGWGRNDQGYRWIDIEGLRLEVGKDGRIGDDVLDSLVGSEVVAVVNVQWRRTRTGALFASRRVLALSKLT